MTEEAGECMRKKAVDALCKNTHQTINQNRTATAAASTLIVSKQNCRKHLQRAQQTLYQLKLSSGNRFTTHQCISFPQFE